MSTTVKVSDETHAILKEMQYRAYKKGEKVTLGDVIQKVIEMAESKASCALEEEQEEDN